MLKFDLFQWLVDASQRQPHWWCRQCTIGAALTFAMTEFSRLEPRTAWSYIGLFAGMSWLAFLWVSSASATSAVGISLNKGVRVLLWCFAGMSLFILFREPSAFRFSSFMSEIMFASVYSFAACRPPAPPKRKREASRLSMGGAA